MDKIASALVKAQRGFAPALKSSTNPHFKSRYADLAACVEAVIDSLNANGIALIQKQHPHDGGVAIETIFLHESGEMLSAGTLTVPAAKQDPQGYGSALTYARRYSLMAACGIAPEDDDGNAATKKNTKPANTDAGGIISGPREVFNSLPPDWQTWLKDFAPQVDNAFEQQGAILAKALIDDAKLDNDVIAGLYSLLSSKTRSALKALPRLATA